MHMFIYEDSDRFLLIPSSDVIKGGGGGEVSPGVCSLPDCTQHNMGFKNLEHS